MLEREHSNKLDVNAVAIKKDGVIVSHSPRAISHISWFLLKRGGHIVSESRGSVGTVTVYPSV